MLTEAKYREMFPNASQEIEPLDYGIIDTLGGKFLLGLMERGISHRKKSETSQGSEKLTEMAKSVGYGIAFTFSFIPASAGMQIEYAKNNLSRS